LLTSNLKEKECDPKFALWVEASFSFGGNELGKNVILTQP